MRRALLGLVGLLAGSVSAGDDIDSISEGMRKPTHNDIPLVCENVLTAPSVVKVPEGWYFIDAGSVGDNGRVYRRIVGRYSLVDTGFADASLTCQWTDSLLGERQNVNILYESPAKIARVNDTHHVMLVENDYVNGVFRRQSVVMPIYYGYESKKDDTAIIEQTKDGIIHDKIHTDNGYSLYDRTPYNRTPYKRTLYNRTVTLLPKGGSITELIDRQGDNLREYSFEMTGNTRSKADGHEWMITDRTVTGYYLRKDGHVYAVLKRVGDGSEKAELYSIAYVGDSIKEVTIFYFEDDGTCSKQVTMPNNSDVGGRADELDWNFRCSETPISIRQRPGIVFTDPWKDFVEAEFSPKYYLDAVPTLDQGLNLLLNVP
ncbi:hypothetical protein COV16_02245 [Candidatus Woesearchaeota archaeon CG10_big_fil_rev_8_21_14_0_10_34_8]|nr:MAG: hypothetical protein COV16_02245 [Candidatus Woesearchaeota archaeon CG10_big_fil_rev_8_21_14_0_10_34_8]